MMEEKDEMTELKERLEQTNHRIDQLENQFGHHHGYGHGSNAAGAIWAFIPITAIVMWGLVKIFG